MKFKNFSQKNEERNSPSLSLPISLNINKINKITQLEIINEIKKFIFFLSLFLSFFCINQNQINLTTYLLYYIVITAINIK